MLRKFLGTFVNVIAILIGSTIGLLFGPYVSEELKTNLFQGFGIITLIVAIYMCRELLAKRGQVKLIIIWILSILAGVIMGHALSLSERIDAASGIFQVTLNSHNTNFSEGLVTAFLLYCVGSLTIVGSIESGVRNNHSLLYIKSMLDGIASIVLASKYGGGVPCSIIPLILLQGTLTAVSNKAKKFFTEAMLSELNAVGGVILAMVAFNLTGNKFATKEFLPAFVIVAASTHLLSKKNKTSSPH
jgi:uncharacterized protein